MARPIGSNSKAKILDAVEALLALQGINDISLRDIAKASQLSLGTLTYHYTSKDAIVMDIIVRHLDELRNEYIAWLGRHEQDLSPERFLEVIFFKGVKLFDRARMHIFLINQCLGENHDLQERFVDKYKEWRLELSRGVAITFKQCPDPEAFAYILMTIIDGLVVQEVLRTEPFDQNRLIAIVKHMGNDYGH